MKIFLVNWTLINVIHERERKHKDNALHSLLWEQVAVLIGTPIPYQMTVHMQDSTDAGSEEGPTTPGDEDDDDDDKDKVSFIY